MHVLYKIDSFGIVTLNNDLKEMLMDEHSSKEEKLNMFRCLANTNDIDILRLFQKAAINLSILEYRSILNRLEEELFTKAIEQFEHFSLNLQLAMIDMIGIRKKIEFVSFLERLLVNENGEIRIRSMKAIGEIGYLSDLAALQHFASSQQWEERLMAAIVIGKTKVQDVPTAELHFDSQRVLRAASSMACLKRGQTCVACWRKCARVSGLRAR